MSQYLSDKLRLLSFVSIVLVLYIHSTFHYTDAEVGGMLLNYYLQEPISSMLGRLAVPMFFAMSGFLFFRGTEENEKKVFQKQRRRIKTLLIPYLLAASFMPIVFLLLKLTGLLDFLVSKSFYYLSEPWWKILFRVFLYNVPDEGPFAFHLWFLRDLIIVVCFTPLLWRLKRLKFGIEAFMAILFVLLLFDVQPAKAFFWFCLGAQFFQKQSPTSLAFVGLLFYVIVSLFQIVFPNEAWRYFEIPMTAIGVLSVWYSYDKLMPQTFSLISHKWLDLLCQSTFFIYLYHIPLKVFVSKSMMLALHPSSSAYAFCYLFSPWITIACLVMIALLLHKFFPRFYSVLVGGRVFRSTLISPNTP